MPDIEQIKRALQSHGGNKTLAAESLGITRSKLRRVLEKDAIRFDVIGKSTLIDRRTDEPILEWVKTSTDLKQREEVAQAVFDALRDKLPRYKPVLAPKQIASDLMSVYVLTDYHLGMLAWGEETSAEDWDLHIAEQMLLDWFSTAIQQAPNSDTAIFAELGDFLHWDGMDAVTPAHKHLLDADTRFPKLVRVAIRVTRQIIEMLAAKHKHVHIIIADANHDPASGAWMREWIASVYEQDQRITVETSADAFYCVEWGNTSVFFHHGHKRGVKNIDDVFVAKFRQVFGRTKHSYAHIGHLHSNELTETNLMQVERHRTLAAPDAYAAKGGWISGRDSKVITYSRKFGEVSRLVISPDMVRYG